MKINIPATNPTFTIPVPTGKTSIVFYLKVSNLDLLSNGAPQLAFSAISCDANVTEDFQASPGSGVGTLGHTDGETLNGLVIAPDIAPGGTYMSQVSGTFTVVNEGASVTLTPGNYSNSAFEVEIEATVT